MNFRQLFLRIRRRLFKWRYHSEPRYARRWLVRLANGRMHSTLGLKVKNEAQTRRYAEEWLAYLRSLGLTKEDLCVEIGCGSLWGSEPTIRFLDPERYIGLDITDQFYKIGQQRLAGLLAEKRVVLARIDKTDLDGIAQLRPRFIFARRVIAHVLPAELPQFFDSIERMMARDTLVVIDNPPSETTHYRNPATINYAVDDIRKHLLPHLDCVQDSNAIRIFHRELDWKYGAAMLARPTEQN